MITAIDTNILLDILLPNPEFFTASAEAVEASANAGSLVICDVVYAEICVYFQSQNECDEFLESVGIRVEPLLREAHFEASRAWRAYRKQGGQRTRILPDFLIAGHALKQAARLLSRDRGFYGKLFPALKLMDPARKKHPESRS